MTGSITGDSTVNFITTGDVTLDSPTIAIDDQTGGHIGGDATLNVALAGNFTSQNQAVFEIGTNDPTEQFMGGSIDGDATLSISAASMSVTNGFLLADIDNNDNGQVGGDALLSFNIGGDVSVPGAFESLFLAIGGGSGSHIGGDATIDATIGGNVNADGGLSLSISTGTIDGSAAILFQSGDIGGGNSSVGAEIFNEATTIGGDATIDFSAGAINLPNNFTAGIFNFEGTIGGKAAITLNADSLTAESLTLQIDSFAGSIGSNATITSNISGTVTTTNDATVTIDITPAGLDQSKGKQGNAPATVGAIDFNGGTYEIGGTLLSTITGGDGGITLNASTMHADILKIGALGDNGTLTIGGGSLSGDSELKLYAGGSNGTIDFVADVTLSSQSSSAIIVANTVTVENGVVVTTQGIRNIPAAVFTNVANYTGSGGNGSTSGMFGGDGAATNPFSQAPPFDDAADSGTTGEHSKSSSGHAAPVPPAIPPHPPRRIAIARVGDSNELLNLANQVTAGASQAGGGTSSRAGDWIGRDRLNDSPAGARILPTRRDFAPNEFSFDRNAGRIPLQVP